LTALLLPRGIATLRFDFFGQGESEGPFEAITVGIAVHQVLAALDLVKSRGYRCIGLVGSSFGGLTAVLAAAQFLTAKNTEIASLKCLALKCPVSDFPAMLEKEFGPMGISEWQATDRIPNVIGGAGRIRLRYSFYEDCTRHLAYAAAGSVTIPTLIVHGDADEDVPVAQSMRLTQSLAGKSSLIILPGADHHFSHPEHFQEMTRRIAEWLAEHLRT
jgi:hypothetical protein